ncbi:MAG TPA: Minf_1886 family protein [Dongiaceae bacterium]|nr:Minf_1886 family protein [Dongiaceae bacterium]
MVEQPFWTAVDDLREHDARYRREAYGFLMLALARTVEGLSPARRADPARRHLSGRELLDGMLSLARAEFGPLAPAVFREWGLERSEDVGEMVFQLVEAGQLSARPEDRREDFAGGGSLPSRLAPGARPARGSRG